MPDYYTINGIVSYQNLHNIHSSSVVNPVGPTLDEINRFHMDIATPGISVATGKYFMRKSQLRENLSLRGEIQYNYYRQISDRKNPAFPATTVIANYIDVSAQAQSLMLNLYLDFPRVFARTNFYGGVGLGETYLYGKTKLFSDPDSFSTHRGHFNLGWNAAIGVQYRVYNNLSLNLAYNYVELGHLDFKKLNASPSGTPGVELFRKIKSNKLVANNLMVGVNVDVC